MSASHIQFEAAAEGIWTAVLDRPEKLNALNLAVIGELDGLLGRVERDAAIRGLIVTGAGDRAFVAGADIGEIAALTPLEAKAMSTRGQAVLRRLERLEKPTVAAINGFALGGGLELALACTLRVASGNAKLGLPEVKLGLLPGYGGTQRLPRLIGRGRALEMLLTGETVDAIEAQRIGLVNHVVEQEDLLEFCRELLRKILANGPVAVQLAMEAVDAGLECGIEEGMRLEAAAFAAALSSEDAREGSRAFLEKRKPKFTGK
jgi:enoyl-CoA hydratase